MNRKERIVRGALASEHIVQFFDTRESLANSVGRFLVDGARKSEHLVVVAKPRNWTAIAARMKAEGVPPGPNDASMTILDAETVLTKFMRHGLPDSVLFHRTVGEMVRRLASEPSGGLRIYGEMVEILAEEGNFHAAQRLEELWNELAVRYSFILLCGYSAAHFASSDVREALAAICSTHSHVQKGSRDPLASWLLDSSRMTPRSPDSDVVPS